MVPPGRIEIEALLSAALSLPIEDAPLAPVSDANTAAVMLLSRYGFQLQRGLRHMHRGPAVPPRRRAQIYGLAGYALG